MLVGIWILVTGDTGFTSCTCKSSPETPTRLGDAGPDRPIHAAPFPPHRTSCSAGEPRPGDLLAVHDSNFLALAQRDISA
jgi:hypothetical protein